VPWNEGILGLGQHCIPGELLIYVDRIDSYSIVPDNDVPGARRGVWSFANLEQLCVFIDEVRGIVFGAALRTVVVLG